MAFQGSTSLSRSSLSKDELAAAADELLRCSISRGSSGGVSSTGQAPTGSLSRSNISSNDVRALTEQLLAKSAGSLSRSPPPSYVSRIGGKSTHSASRRLFDATSSLSARRAPAAQATRGNMKKEALRELHEARAAHGRHPDSKELFKRLCSTDLLFLIDTTNSMGPYIETVKQQVRSIVADIHKAFFGQSDVRIGIVSYKDHGCSPNVQKLDFTSSLSEVHAFLDNVKLDWGRDFPEDVLGGIDAAIGASWTQQTRCLVHIGDAPPHGSVLNDFGSQGDDYNEPGSEPHGLTYEPLLRRLLELRVNYAFLHIEPYTDRMALSFAKIYGPGNAKVLHSSKYAEELGSLDCQSEKKSFNVSASQPKFEELRLGTTYSELRHLVLQTVTSSLSRTVGHFTQTRSQLETNSPSHGASASAISSPEPSASLIPAGITLESGPPQWDDAGWFGDTWDMEGFLPAGMHDAITLQRMMDSDDNITLSVATDVTVHSRSKPFANGAMRTASYARTEASNSHFVLKSFIKGQQPRATVVEEMKVQALCKAFALEFNGLLEINPPLDFVVTGCLQEKANAGGECRSIEPYIEGNYIKYNSNLGVANDDITDDFNQMAQAFSHFTFERSWGHFLVSDLQGVNHLLTDPAIQTKSQDRYPLSNTNLGETGIKFFFVFHECNVFCHRLGLKSNKEMVQLGQFDFRETWPAMEPTICCSNKFCRAITRTVNSHEASKYPGYRWCDKCFPQLEAFTSRYMCEEPGEDHDFEVSRFFHESQGEAVPRECAEHRAPDVESTSTATVGGKLFSKSMSRMPSVSSISGKMW